MLKIIIPAKHNQPSKKASRSCPPIKPEQILLASDAAAIMYLARSALQKHKACGVMILQAVSFQQNIHRKHKAHYKVCHHTGNGSVMLKVCESRAALLACQ